MDKRDNKKRYQEFKAAGICTQCKRNKALNNRVKCGPCLYDDREYRRAKREINKNKGKTSMIIILEDEIYKNKSNKEVLKIIANIFENKFNYPGISIIYNSNLEELKEKARKLDCLEAAGVDNWILYPDAMAELDPGDKEEDDTNDFLDTLEEFGE